MYDICTQNFQSKLLCTEILIRLLAIGYDVIMHAYIIIVTSMHMIHVVRMGGAGGLGMGCQWLAGLATAVVSEWLDVAGSNLALHFNFFFPPLEIFNCKSL